MTQSAVMNSESRCSSSSPDRAQEERGLPDARVNFSLIIHLETLRSGSMPALYQSTS